MTVEELMSYLKLVPGDTIVLLSKDEEGNGFKELDFFEFANCDVSWPPEIRPIHPDDEHEYEEQGVKLEKRVVLWP